MREILYIDCMLYNNNYINVRLILMFFLGRSIFEIVRFLDENFYLDYYGVGWVNMVYYGKDINFL